MSLEIVRRIRGNVHGSIDITELEDKVLTHSYFQRLRRIKQLAFLHYVFPGATHTRFEHSLGVMHLAGLAWNKVKQNQERLYHSLSRYGDFSQIEANHMKTESESHGSLSPTFAVIGQVFNSDYILQTFRLAALLHDIGHPPFSHSGERFLANYTEVIESNPELPEYLVDYLKSAKDPSKAVRHEIYSALLIHELLEDTYKKHPNLIIKVNPRDVVSIIIHNIDPSPESPLITHRAHELCRELISGELDIDRMDYLIRDSRECGVVYGVFDVHRILDSLCLYHDEHDNRLHVAINYSGLPAFEDYLRARYSMYLQLYFHKSSVAAEAMIAEIMNMLPHFKLPANIKEYASIDEYKIHEVLLREAKNIDDEKKRKACVELVNDLLFERDLWKRVFEITGTDTKKGLPILEQAKEIIAENGFPFQQVSSANSLTRFQPREAKNKRSKNYLRIIKKDIKQFPRVTPIEDHSTIIDRNQKSQSIGFTQVLALIVKGVTSHKELKNC